MKIDCIQIGLDGEQEIKGVKSFLRGLSFADIRLLLDRVDFWISADNFFQHFAHYYGKKGFVIFALSDPKIFGWEDNINLLKDRKYLRAEQFNFWTSDLYNNEAFVSPKEVLKAVKKFI